MNDVFLTDNKLVYLLQSGSAVAFEGIYKRYWSSVFITALKKIQDKAVAEEIAQNVFESLWQNREAVTIENLSHYLHTAVKYQVFNHFRAELAKQKLIRFTIQMEALQTQFNENDPLAVREITELVHNTLEELPPKTKQVFKLSRYQHFSNKEISHLLCLSEKSVEYHITQSLKLLRLRLKSLLF